RRPNGGAIQVEPSHIPLRARAVELSDQLIYLRLVFFNLLRGREILQIPISLILASGLCKSHRDRCDRRLRLMQGELEARTVEHKDHIVFVPALVFLDANLRTHPAHTRTNLENAAPHAPVAVPRLKVVINPKPPSSNQRQREDAEC